MIKTMGVQPYLPSSPIPYLAFLTVDDVLKYLDHDIVVRDGHAFLDREDLRECDVFTGTKIDEQFYTNGLLISGLTEYLEEVKFNETESKVEEIIKSLINILERNLKSRGIHSSHSAFVHRDEENGDIVVGFWKSKKLPADC